jgi:hypothetical protein
MTVMCPIDGRPGVLHKVSKRAYRIRHTSKQPHCKRKLGWSCYHWHYRYCKVPPEWAEEQIARQRAEQEP